PESSHPEPSRSDITRPDLPRLDTTRRPQDTREDIAHPEPTREEAVRPRDTREDVVRPQNTREDIARPGDTREDVAQPRETRKDGTRVENGREGAAETRTDTPREAEGRVRRPRLRMRQRELPIPPSEEQGPQQRHDVDNDSDARDSGDGAESDWSGRPRDGWSELDRDGIVEKLEDDWDLDVTGFDNPHVDVEVLREFARAIEDMFTRFPDTELQEVRIAPIDDDGVFAEVDPGRDSDGYFADTLTLNERFARNPEDLARRVRLAEENGHLVPGSGERPLYSTIVHEFAHAIDFTTQMQARVDAFEALERHYLRTRGDYDGFLDWLNEELSGYSFDEHGMYDHAEALAEAFTDVILNGELASEPAQLLYDHLRQVYRAHAADNPVYADPTPDHRARAADGDDPGPAARRDREPPTWTGDEQHDAMRGREDGEKPAHEPELVLSPPEPVEVPEVSPIDDHWAGKDRQGIIDHLENELGIKAVGFHYASDVEMLREYSRAIEELIAQPPGIKPRSIEIGFLPEDPSAIAIAYPMRTEDGRLVPDRIVFNEMWAMDPAGFEAKIHADVAAGFHVSGADARPMYAVIVHEYAHLVDFYGQREARVGLVDDLIQHYVATHEGSDFAEFTNWLRSELPGYAFDEHNMLKPGEALAEAYRDVKLNGDNASELSKLMAYRLEMAARDAIGLHPPDADPAHLRSVDDRPDLLGPSDRSEDSSTNPPEHRAASEPPPGADEPSPGAEEPGLPISEDAATESSGPATEPRVGDERWFDQRMAEHADFVADMEAKHARFLHEMADTAIPGSSEEHLFREQAREVDAMARASAERAERLWDDLGGRPDPDPTGRSVGEDGPVPETAPAGEGQPPNDGPPRRPAATPDD
ncbi:hypothetical protein, partial [Nocardia sp. JMUB6875]|uniref:hypothetical protein n=1 Tax=Nocardia sp. JMUB6875 TaxID=3158170 RepID=UPI0034E8E032